MNPPTDDKQFISVIIESLTGVSVKLLDGWRSIILLYVFFMIHSLVSLWYGCINNMKKCMNDIHSNSDDSCGDGGSCVSRCGGRCWK